jgi:pimeloyl-ACP methyl ester carboxylesterase
MLRAIISLSLLVNFTVAFSNSIFEQYANLHPPSKSKEMLPEDPDVGKGMEEIVRTRGYHMETHYVTTSDGYILTMYNIPYGKKSGSTTRNKIPVILQHGLLDSSYTWVCNYDDQSLAFILADHGFDVWMGNNRGNRYGRNHTTFNPDVDEEFWKFSWDEMASIDVPTFINYVTAKTNTSSVGWVGHSEGTIQMFAAGSMTDRNAIVKEAVAKVNLFVALAPVAYVHNIKVVPLQALSQTDVLDVAYSKGVYEFFPYGRSTQFAPTLCRYDADWCDSFFDVMMGPSENLNKTRLQVYVSEEPAGTSTKNLDHWEQGVLVDTYQAYDWGTEEENSKRYGQSTPPLYELNKFVLNVALFTGTNDFLADPTDVQRMVKELPASKIVFQNNQEDYAHCDFVWAPNAATRIYPQVKLFLHFLSFFSIFFFLFFFVDFGFAQFLCCSLNWTSILGVCVYGFPPTGNETSFLFISSSLLFFFFLLLASSDENDCFSFRQIFIVFCLFLAYQLPSYAYT